MPLLLLLFLIEKLAILVPVATHLATAADVFDEADHAHVHQRDDRAGGEVDVAREHDIGLAESGDAVPAVVSMPLGPTLVLVLFAAAMIAATNGLADVFKYGFQRLRPCYDTSLNELMRLVKDSCGGKFGYFSAHAGNTMAVATFFSILLKRTIRYIGILLLVWAILVGYSRIYIGVHFPLDVFTGMVVGLFFGWVFAKLFIFGLTKISL